MSFCTSHARRLIAGGACCVAILVTTVHAQSPEEFARRRLASGRAFLAAGNYSEALKDFEAVLQSYPTTSIADDALLEIATYQFEVARDLNASDARVKELAKSYPGSDSAAMALVLEGRVALARARDDASVNAALASFDRVPRLFPGSDAVPASMYFGGEAARLGGDRAQAIQRFTDLATQFPRSSWTPRALLAAALTLVRAGQPVRAMEQLQRVRIQFARSPEALTALDWNTVLYRMYLRAPAGPAFLFSGRSVPGPSGKLKDVASIAIDKSNNLLVATKGSVMSFGFKGNQLPAIPAVEPETVRFDRFGKMLTVQETGLRVEGRTPVPIVPPTADGKPRELKVTDALVTSTGEYLLADRETKTILKFQPDGKYVGEFAKMIAVRRMAMSDLDEVAALDRDEKAVSIFSRDGKLLKQIPERGPNYQLRNPSDVAFDAFGHLYVLDRTAVLVFAPGGARLLTTFSTQEKSPGALGEGNALALDTAGRLYVFDGRTDSVKVYR